MAFRVTDLAKARAFYGSYLGFAEPFDLPGGVAVFKINDNQFIELHEEPAPPGDVNFQLRSMAFSTSDAGALRAYYASKGIEVPAAVGKDLLGNPSFALTDRDGHTIEWVEYAADSMTGTTRGQALPDTRVGTTVHHFGVTIADAAQATAFYDGMLGFEPSMTADKEAAKVPEGDVRIEYGTYHSAPTKDFAVVRDHLCLRVADTTEAIVTLSARDPAVVIEHHILHDFTVRANVQDPDGTRIEMADSILLPDGEATGPGDEGHLTPVGDN
jgi:catechol 2,3-dioxygenase-like lactoylglutathione lyase family enzyme